MLYCGISAASLAVLVLLVILVLPPAPMARVTSALVRSFTGIPVFMKSLEWGLDGHVEIYDFKLSSWSLGVVGLDVRMKKISIEVQLLKSLRSRALILNHIHVVEPKISVVLRPEKAGQTESSAGAGMMAALPLRVGVLIVEMADLKVKSPWGQLAINGSSVDLSEFAFPEISLASLDVGWKNLEIESYGGSQVKSDMGTLKAQGNENQKSTEINVYAPYDIISEFSSFVPRGLVTLNMQMPDWDSFREGENKATIKLAASLEDRKVLLVKGYGGIAGGRLGVEKGKLPADLLFSASWLSEVVGSIEGSYLEWNESSANGQLMAQATGFLPLVKGVKAIPDLVMDIKLKGNLRKDGTLLGRLKGRALAGNIYEQELDGFVEVRERITASLGMGLGQLDLKALSEVFPIANQISMAGLISLEGPKIRYEDSGHGGAEARAELSALSKGVQLTWAEGKNEAVTIFARGLSIDWQGNMPVTRSADGLVVFGTLTASQKVIEIGSRIGVLKVPDPVVNAISRISLKPPFRTKLSLSAEHRESLAPAGLLQKATMEAEAWLSPSEGIQAVAKLNFPDLGTRADVSWNGFQGNLNASISPPAASLKPYLDHIEGGMDISADFSWPLPQPFRVDGAEITYSGLRFLAQELDSGFLYGSMAWVPNLIEKHDFTGHQTPWVQDLLPAEAKGTKFSIKRFSYGNVEGDLDFDMVAKGKRIVLSKIQGNLMSGSVLGKGLVTWVPSEGIRYSLDLAASDIQPRRKSSGKGISLNTNLRGLSLEPEGQANVVRISAKDLAALFLALDPNGQNENIVKFRNYLKYGLVPKRVTVTVKHGQVNLDVVLGNSKIWTKVLSPKDKALVVDFPLRKLVGVFVRSALEEG